MVDSHSQGNLYYSRHKRLHELLIKNSQGFIAVNPGPGLVYLTGLSFHLMERPVVGIFREDGLSAIVLPELETPKLETIPINIRSFVYGEDPAGWLQVFKQAVQFVGIDNHKVGVEPNSISVFGT